MSGSATPTQPRAEESRIERVASKLARIRNQSGSIGRRRVETEAEKLGISAETLYRRIRGIKSKKKRKQYEFGEREIEWCYAVRGNMVQLRKLFAGALKPLGLTPPSLATLYRAYRRLPAWERGAIEQGEKGWREKLLRIVNPQGICRRNQVWELDHAQLGIWTIVPRKGRGTTSRKIWVTTVKDAHTRKILGWAYARNGQRPGRKEVQEALHMAISRYGAPEVIRWDNALEWLANETTDIVLDLESIPMPTDSYEPSQKGRVERYHWSIDQLLLSVLPGWDRAPRDKRGKLTGITLKENDFIRIFGQWVDWFNDEHVHSELGCTPSAAWNADPAPLRMIPEHELRWLMTHEETRIMDPRGLEVDGTYFSDLKLKDFVGEPFRVRFIRHDLREIEVLKDGTHFCMAAPQGTDPDFDADLLKARAADYTTVQRRRSASERTRIQNVEDRWGTLDEATASEEPTSAPAVDNFVAAQRRQALPVHDLLSLPALDSEPRGLPPRRQREAA